MIKGGPKIINDGLVLCLDAHDAKSYAGEPVTNLASGSWFTWVNSGAWTSNTYTSHESCPVGFPPGLKGVSGVQVLEGICTTTGSIHFGTGHVNPASASTQYTYSVWFYQKGRAGIGGPYARANVSNSNLGTMKYNGTTGSSNWPVNKWIKLEITFTTQGSDTQTYISNYFGSQVGDTMYFCAPQSEQKSYYSPYANSSRSATNGWVDRSGNNNSGTLTNMVGTGASHYRDGQVIMPVANSYLDFDGSDDYVSTSFGSGRDVYSNPISFVAWVKASVGTNNKMWLDHGSNGTNQRLYSALITADNPSAFGIQGSPWSLPSSADTSKWYHQAIVMDSGTARAYYDGIAAGTKSYTSYTLPGNTIVGGRSGYIWDGQIACFAVYDKALSAAEVLSNYNATKQRFS